MPYYTSFHYTEDLEGQTPAAPEQGFEGEDVQHEDMDTMTGDWRREYGPKGPPKHPGQRKRKSNPMPKAPQCWLVPW